MLSVFKSYLRKATKNARLKSQMRYDRQMLALGKLLCSANHGSTRRNTIHDYEFSIFSQWGDDGIIQWLVRALDVQNHCFVEFGVEDYLESNTRFLLMNNNWSGLILDGSSTNLARITASELMWKYELYAKAAFVDRANVNQLLKDQPFGREIGLLHIDIDGNDYWIWEAIDVISPAIAIIEYNSVFGCDRAITVPYRPDFQRMKAHYSNLYYGASLPAIYELALTKGFTFIGCNSAGNNAYFVRNDHLSPEVIPQRLEEGYVVSRFRESRDTQGALTYVSDANRIDQLRGLPVWNTRRQCIEAI